MSARSIARAATRDSRSPPACDHKQHVGIEENGQLASSDRGRARQREDDSRDEPAAESLRRLL